MAVISLCSVLKQSYFKLLYVYLVKSSGSQPKGQDPPKGQVINLRSQGKEGGKNTVLIFESILI